jgi:alpha-L-rhamnosidase
MPVDPAIAARFPLMDGVTVADLIAQAPAALERLEAFSAPYAEYTAPEVDVVARRVPGPHGDIPVRVYTPEQPSGAGLVWLHGGAFMMGDLDMPEADSVARELCARTGAVIASVDYRLARDGVHFPVPHDDVVAAYRWAAAELGVERLALGGASAGGNLAAGAALRLRDEGDPLPCRLLLVYPVLHDVLPETPGLNGLPAALRFPQGAVAAINRNYLGGARATPYAFPALGDAAGLPPTLILTAEYDDLRGSGEAFAAQLCEAGVDVDLACEPGVLHGHLNLHGHPATARSLELLASALTVRVHDVRFEHQREALGIGERAPRISFKVATDIPGWTQTAYELEVDGEPQGRVESAESVLVPGVELAPRQRRSVRVRVWGDDVSAWSAPAVVERGIEDWSARMVAAPPGLLRREFALRGEVASARLYATAHGVYELELNGQRVGDHVLAPGWTSYHHRLRFQTFDVTLLLRRENALGAWLAEGWFAGRLGFNGGVEHVYGDRTALLAQLEVTYADGSSERFGTDGQWRCAPGPIVASSLYDGEIYDARLELDGWSSPGFDDAGWAPVEEIEHDAARLVAPNGPPVRRTQLVDPVDSFGTIVDFGQNLVGRLRIRVRGEAGQTVTLRHAEVLEDGELSIRPLRGARATDEYTLRGDGVEEWEPRFTFHGFRYAELTGVPVESVTAVVCHTDMERTGWFSSSEPDLNRLHENVIWGMRGNFLDVPTDCPQRDERLGWTGDAQVFAPTASFLYDCAGMLTSWLRDVAAEQTDEGVVPVYVPFVELTVPEVPAEELGGPVAAWGDAAVIVPWVLYERFGDPHILASQFESMQAWVDGVADRAGDTLLWDKGLQLGDWLDPTAPPDQPWAAATDAHLVAQAYFARSAELLSRAAGVLGREPEAQLYRNLADDVRHVFGEAYGEAALGSQTGCALALEFGLLRDREAAGRRLAELVESAGHRIATGFVGTPLVCDALTHAGALDTAYRLLLQRECPSWLYSVTMGATTVWERWDSLLPDGTVNPGEMTSFNHYALGAVADWLHRTVAGLAPAAPGYRKLLVAPRPGGGLTHASATHETPYGRASVRWEQADELTVDVVVPPGATATISLPGAEPFDVGSGRHRFTA